MFSRVIWINNEPITHKIVPLGTVLTMVGTGSEMDAGSVINDTENKIKNDSNLFNPDFSILNPEYTFTVSKYQMVSSIFDTMSRLMEQYFSSDDYNTSDYILKVYTEVLYTLLRLLFKIH